MGVQPSQRGCGATDRTRTSANAGNEELEQRIYRQLALRVRDRGRRGGRRDQSLPCPLNRLPRKWEPCMCSAYMQIIIELSIILRKGRPECLYIHIESRLDVAVEAAGPSSALVAGWAGGRLLFLGQIYALPLQNMEQSLRALQNLHVSCFCLHDGLVILIPGGYFSCQGIIDP